MTPSAGYQFTGRDFFTPVRGIQAQGRRWLFAAVTEQQSEREAGA